jgi:hypothetical protein
MFEQFFTQPATIAHHHSSPYATERRRHLSLLMQEGPLTRQLAGHRGVMDLLCAASSS